MTTTDPEIPRWEKVNESGFIGVRAVCEPDGYCRDGHRCGRLDVGIVPQATLNTTNDFEVFTDAFEEWAHAEAERQNAEIEAMCERSVEMIRHWLGPFRPTAFPALVESPVLHPHRTVMFVVDGRTVAGVTFLPPEYRHG